MSPLIYYNDEEQRLYNALSYVNILPIFIKVADTKSHERRFIVWKMETYSMVGSNNGKAAWATEICMICCWNFCLWDAW